MKILSAIIKKPVTVILATVLILGLGALACFNMSTNLLPNIAMPVLSVSVVYPGAGADTVEKDVTAPMQKALKSVGGVTDITTYSIENASTVVIFFDYGTNLKDKKAVVEDKIKAVALPQSAAAPAVLEIDLNATPAVTFSMYNEKDDFSRLTLDANAFKSELEGVDGVGSVSLSGAPSYEIKVTPLSAGALSFDNAILLIVQAVQGSQLDIPLGTVMANGEEVIVRNVAEVKTAAQLRELPVIIPPDFWVPLKAQIPPESLPLLAAMGYVFPAVNTADMILPLKLLATVGEPQTQFSSLSYINGKQGVTLSVNKNQQANTSAVVKSAKTAAADFDGESKIIMLDDQAAFINESIANVIGSMIIGGALAIIIIFMFLRNVRSGIVISITMPLSVLAALGLLFICGVSLNMVSLGGLAVGIGMLVDNSIVVIESITRHRDRGENPYLASLNGTRSVAGSIFASTLTTVCVFFPIMFAGGLTAEIFTDLALAVIFSLSMSFIVSVTVIPALYCLLNRGKRYFLQGSILCANNNVKTVKSAAEGADEQSMPITALVGDAPLQQTEQEQIKGVPAFCDSEQQDKQKLSSHKNKKEKTNKGKGKIMTTVENGYASVLPMFLRNKLATILISVGVFALSIVLVFTTGTEFLPPVDNGLIEVHLSRENATLETLNTATNGFAEAISGTVDGIDSIAVNVGKQSLLDVSPEGKIRIQLTKSGKTQKTVEKIRELSKNVEGYKVKVKEIDGVVAVVTGGFDDGISVEVTGSDLTALKDISQKVQAELVGKEGFRLVYDNLSGTRTEMTVTLNKFKCAQYGIDPDVVAMTLRAGMTGIAAGEIKDGKINVSFADGSVDTLDKLKAFVLGSHEGNPVTLGDVSVFESVQSGTSISTSNGKYLATITAETYGLDTGSASKTMSGAVKNVLKDYPDYAYANGGVQSYLSDAFGGLVVALIISFFLLYAVMAAQFESAIKPLIVMTSIPLSFTGAFLALALTRSALNVVSFIGIIMLMGVIVNNAIVMMDKIAALLKQGLTPQEAVIEGAKSRLRPILMTTLTTVLALFPLSLGLGSGGALMQPLGIVVMGGLILGTAVTLLLIPAVYCAFMKIKFPPLPKKQKTEKIENQKNNSVSPL